MKCKCEHWQICPVCSPSRFDADGNLLPPEPTPLEAARTQITALLAALFQAQQAAKNFKAREWQGLTGEEIANIANELRWSDTYHLDFTRAIEAKLKEKNT